MRSKENSISAWAFFYWSCACSSHWIIHFIDTFSNIEKIQQFHLSDIGCIGDSCRFINKCNRKRFADIFDNRSDYCYCKQVWNGKREQFFDRNRHRRYCVFDICVLACTACACNNNSCIKKRLWNGESLNLPY